jgi:hypothetical protein
MPLLSETNVTVTLTGAQWFSALTILCAPAAVKARGRMSPRGQAMQHEIRMAISDALANAALGIASNECVVIPFSAREI